MVLPTGGAALAQDDAPSTATYDAAAYADAERMMDGLMGERIFGADPSAQVTRAQFVRGVTKIFGVPELGSGGRGHHVLQPHARPGVRDNLLRRQP